MRLPWKTIDTAGVHYTFLWSFLGPMLRRWLLSIAWEIRDHLEENLGDSYGIWGK